MSGSFDGAAFGERGQSATAFPVWSKPAVIVTKKIPGGDVNVIQKIGMGPSRLALVVKVTKTQLTALYGKVGASGALVFGWETATATLESIEGEEQLAGRDVYFATLNLIRGESISMTPATARLIESGDTRVTESGDIRVTE